MGEIWLGAGLFSGLSAYSHMHDVVVVVTVACDRSCWADCEKKKKKIKAKAWTSVLLIKRLNTYPAEALIVAPCVL